MTSYAFTGDRYWHRDYLTTLWDFTQRELLDGDHVILGDCPSGVDRIMKWFCEDPLKDVVTYEIHEVEWSEYGKGAGHIRNSAMLASKPDFLVAVHLNFERSKGTLNCVSQAKKLKIPIVYLLDKA